MRTNSTPSICTCKQIVPHWFSHADKQYPMFLHRRTNSIPSVNFTISLDSRALHRRYIIICHTVLRIRPFVHSYWVDAAIIVGNKWMSQVLGAIVNTFWSAAQWVRDIKTKLFLFSLHHVHSKDRQGTLELSACTKRRGTICPRVQIDGVLFVRQCKNDGVLFLRGTNYLSVIIFYDKWQNSQSAFAVYS